MITGHTALLQGLSYIAAQLVGAISGAAITKALRGPDQNNLGCFGPTDLTRAQLWGWETIMTFLLVAIVYATAVSQKLRIF